MEAVLKLRCLEFYLQWFLLLQSHGFQEHRLQEVHLAGPQGSKIYSKYDIELSCGIFLDQDGTVSAMVAWADSLTTGLQGSPQET